MGNKNKQIGFTIVELLIVIVVIGILAAITLVAFGGIRDRANDSAVQSDIKNAGALVEQHLAIHGSVPTTLTAATLRALGTISPTKSAYGNHYNNGTNDYNFVYCYNLTSNQFAIVAASASGKTYQYSSIDRTLKEHGLPLTGSATTCGTGAGRAGIASPTGWWGYSTASAPTTGWVL